MHRGPAAAAIICMGTLGWTPAEGLAWLKEAQTATNYVGLFKTVETFRPPSKEALAAAPSHFPEVAKTEALIDTMVSVDEQWDKLKAVRKAGYRIPANSPDLRPTAEATLLREHFREAQRLLEARARGADFLDHLKGAEGEVQKLELMLGEAGEQPGEEMRVRLDHEFSEMNQRCAACHKLFRNPTTSKLPHLTGNSRVSAR
jgi:hypothetical protein